MNPAPAELMLGWRETDAGDPLYWLQMGARPGGQAPDDPVCARAASVACHTAIVA
jgi:hypothetical protein